jgi:Leucine-rich repeat (LRR) protein
MPLQVNLMTMLPPATPALGSLQYLALMQLGLTELPGVITSCLKVLRHLDLSSNRFNELPAAIKDLTSLEFLNLASNSGLQFKPSDADTLAGLPSLRALRLREKRISTANGVVTSSVKWTEDSAGAFIGIARCFPSLELICSDERSDGDHTWPLWG